MLPPHQADIFHHEAELAAVIGQEAKDLSDEEAMDAVFGYVAYNDVSARGLGRKGINSFLGKSFDTFAAFGPWIVTKDEIPDPQSLSVTVDVNGERRQDYSTSDMERPVRELMTYISSVTTLHPWRCDLLRHEPPGSGLDAGRGRGCHHRVEYWFVRCSRSGQACAEMGSRDRPRNRGEGESGGAASGGASKWRIQVMRLVLTSDDRIGVERIDGIVDVSAAFDDIRFRTAADRMPRVLAVLKERRGRVEELAASGKPTAVSQLQAPVPRPPKLIAAFGNYREGSSRERQTQDMFLESPDSVIGPNGTVVLPDHPATIFLHEAELALVIGSRAKDLPANEQASGGSGGLHLRDRRVGAGPGSGRTEPYRQIVRHLHATWSGYRDHR